MPSTTDLEQFLITGNVKRYVTMFLHLRGHQ